MKNNNKIYYKLLFNSLKCLFVLLFTLSSYFVHSQVNTHFNTPENLVKHLYDQVSFPAGETPDWDYVRTFFIEESTVVMRMGKNETSTLTLDGWVQDFVNFIENADILTTGFEEKIIELKPMIFGDIAHILVLYTSYIPGKSKAPREGVDSFHLIKKEGRWWIVSILNEIPTSYRSKPSVFNK